MGMRFSPGAWGKGEMGMLEMIVVGAIVVMALVFITKNLYHKAAGNSACGCEGKVCSKKKKLDM